MAADPISSGTTLPDVLEHRRADHDIEDIFLKRWSPRAMSGEPLADAQLMRLFEAARWAPSTNNEQEWRFCYAKRDTPAFEQFFSFLYEGNQIWCGNAAVLVVVCSMKTFSRNGKPNPVHSFDAGAAFQNLALQGAMMGLVIHGMAGFDQGKARQELDVPDHASVEAMIAIGHPGDPSTLPETLAQKDRNPSGRNKVEQFIAEGKFAF